MTFTVLPAYYQTRWFLAISVVGMFAALYLAYLLRIRQVTQQVRARMQERMDERERIARNLHDTLLQSVQGLILKVGAAAKRSEPEAREGIEKALDSADRVLAEGRDRIRNLRDGAVSLTDLPSAFQLVAEETPRSSEPAFNLVVEGDARELHPMVLEEIYYIGREALINALGHSGGLHLEVEITYDARQFRLRVRDDGRGIDPLILEKGGREDHWDLQGIRERACRIGARLDVWSRPGSGTEVELTVPTKTAYRLPRGKSTNFRPRVSTPG